MSVALPPNWSEIPGSRWKRWTMYGPYQCPRCITGPSLTEQVSTGCPNEANNIISWGPTEDTPWWHRVLWHALNRSRYRVCDDCWSHIADVIRDRWPTV